MVGGVCRGEGVGSGVGVGGGEGYGGLVVLKVHKGIVQYKA